LERHAGAVFCRESMCRRCWSMATIGLFFRSVFGVDCNSGGFRVSTGTAASGVEDFSSPVTWLDTSSLTRQAAEFPVQIRIDPSGESKGGSRVISRHVHLQLFFFLF